MDRFSSEVNSVSFQLLLKEKILKMLNCGVDHKSSHSIGGQNWLLIWKKKRNRMQVQKVRL